MLTTTHLSHAPSPAKENSGIQSFLAQEPMQKFFLPFPPSEDNSGPNTSQFSSAGATMLIWHGLNPMIMDTIPDTHGVLLKTWEHCFPYL